MIGLLHRLLWMTVLYAGLMCTYPVPPASAAELSGIAAEHSGRQTQVKISYNTPVSEPTVFTLGGDRPRVVIDIAATEPESALSISGLDGQGSAAQHIRYAPRDSGTRIVIDLAHHAEMSGFIHSGNLTTVNLRLPEGAVLAPKRIAQFSKGGIPIPQVKPVPTMIVAKPKRIIVIDPGHGGYDPGALGKKGTKEKKVTLSAALELKKEFEKTGRYTVVLTRDKDVYVALDERVRRARRADADLFISLHADSHANASTQGASVYTLADHARRRSTNLVSEQNWIMDIDLNETPKAVDDILVDLAQRKTFSRSAQFADILIPELEKVTPVLNNTHRRAGLFVLLAPDVPAVLVEMGFLSNSDDETRLLSKANREKKMKAIVKASDAYFEQLDAQ